MTDEKKYDFSFFKPLSGHAKANRKLILILASIWAVAVFGFQIALILLNEPTPEASYEVFQSVYPEVVENETADVEMKQDFSRALLAVLGKNIALSSKHKETLKGVLSWTVFTMQADSVKSLFQNEPVDEAYTQAAVLIGLQPDGFDKIALISTDIKDCNCPAIKSDKKCIKDCKRCVSKRSTDRIVFKLH